MERGPRIKTANYLVFKKAEASVPVGASTLKIRGSKRAFSDPKYQLMVEDGPASRTKAEGTYMDMVGTLRKNPKTWLATAAPLEKIGEALSDEKRDIRKNFTIAELICISRLDVERDPHQLSRLTGLSSENLNKSLKSLQEKRMVSVKDSYSASLTTVGQGILKHLSEDPVFIRIVSLLEQKIAKLNEGKK